MEQMTLTSYYEESLKVHAKSKGLLEVASKVKVKETDDVTSIYIHGVADSCMHIAQNPGDARKCTIKGNTIMVVSDGSSIAGQGNIGPLAALPAVEGMAVLLKELGGIDAVPIPLDTQDTEEIIKTVKNIAPAFGGVILIGIASSRSYEIASRLKNELEIPVFHDDVEGMAVAMGAATIGAFRLLGRELSDVSAVVCGAGPAGLAVTKMLSALGVRDIVVCDSKGIIGVSRLLEFGESKLELLEVSNKDGITGSLADAVAGRHLFVGVSVPGALTKKMAESMAEDSVIFTMAQPGPEINSDLAKASGARIVGTGNADLPNYITSVLASPGIFRGALDAETMHITEAMMSAAANALASLVSENELNEQYILPTIFKRGIVRTVADAVESECRIAGESNE